MAEALLSNTDTKNTAKARKRRHAGLSDEHLAKLVAQDPILNIKQVATATGRCDRTIRRAVWAQELRAMRQGTAGHLFFKWSEIQRWLASQETALYVPRKPR